MSGDKVTIPLIAAHRGSTDSARENTREAFSRAVELGADMIEIDVRRSADGVLLVHHDRFVTRDNREYVIAEVDYRALGSLADYQIPRLEEVLAEFGRHIRFDIELKETGYEEYFLDAVLKHIPRGRFVCTSFHDSTVAALKKMDPAVPVGLLLGERDPVNLLNTRLTEMFPWRRRKRCGADFLAPHYALASYRFVKAAAAKRIPLYIWTVNQPRLIERFCRWRVDVVITDHAQKAIDIRDGLSG
ncbi:MAG: glycerophosphodiester phosphodiesterase [Firmicutes bacterium]|nr:glycerophosphodiester phosphodiesterase [Bacillota bacterium]